MHSIANVARGNNLHIRHNSISTILALHEFSHLLHLKIYFKSSFIISFICVRLRKTFMKIHNSFEILKCVSLSQFEGKFVCSHSERRMLFFMFIQVRSIFFIQCNVKTETNWKCIFSTVWRRKLSGFWTQTI